MADGSPLPSPPFIDIPGISNLRDIGGYTTASGKRTRRGLVFRSADPTKATEEGLKKLSEELKVTTIFDLRSTSEIQRSGPEWGGVPAVTEDIFQPYGIAHHWTPVFANKDYGPEKIALRYQNYTRDGSVGFVAAYRDILRTGGGTAYRVILRHLSGSGGSAEGGDGRGLPEPCLVHCTAGKDRTGILVAVLFDLVGVKDEEIAEEYALTDLGLAALKPLFVERLLKNPVLQGNRSGVENMVSSKKENMLASLEMLRTEFGGAERYVKEVVGLSDEEVRRLKANLVEE